MEIKFSPFLYAFSMVSAVKGFFWFFKSLYNFKKTGITYPSHKKTFGIILLSALFISNSIHLFYNLFAVIVGYGQSYVRYRAVHTNRSEKILQVLEIDFDSVQISTIILAVHFFRKPLEAADIFVENKDKHVALGGFTFIFSIARLILHHAIFFMFKKEKHIALMIIDTLNVSENLFLLFLYVIIYLRLNECSRKIKQSGSFGLMAFESAIKAYKKHVAKLCYSFSMNFVYRMFLVIIGTLGDNALNYFILDLFFLLRLAAVDLQFDNLIEVCFMRDDFVVDEEKMSVKIVKMEKKHDEKIEKNKHEYFASSNENQKGVFTLF